jgi:hypothetical protein
MERWLDGSGFLAESSSSAILDQGLKPIRLVDGDKRVLDRDPSLFPELAQRAGYRFARSARHRCHLFMGQQQWKPEFAAIHMFANLV